MELPSATLSLLAKAITGDSGSPVYRSGPKLVDLFNEFGARDEYSYGGGFPTRWVYAKQKLVDLNGTAELDNVIREAFHPRHFVDCGGHREVLEYLNKHLRFDGYELQSNGDDTWVESPGSGRVKFTREPEVRPGASAPFIDEQIEKCERKIASGDFDGAITNARSLVEAVLVDLESDFDSGALPYDGDLPRLYKRVQKHLNLAPGRTDIAQPLKQVLSGLQSVVQGVSGLRNRMSDAHAVNYRPKEHHAKLVVNSAMTLVGFLYATKSYQAERKD